MKKEQIISAFCQLGKVMQMHGNSMNWSGFDSGVTEEEFELVENAIQTQVHFNGWFTEELVRKSFRNLSEWLTKAQLEDWTNHYKFTETPKSVAVIMAGNIPL
ncbi:MAG: hypothetical protein EBU01_11490, partial [Crocinitomicaceae bacterium]|nr:hypothetical protein [Crocinitomicaceae bacterium]